VGHPKFQRAFFAVRVDLTVFKACVKNPGKVNIGAKMIVFGYLLLAAGLGGLAIMWP
jgi:hypothetical protein